MIVCHCNCIEAACIERSARAFGSVTPGRSVTADEIYDMLGKAPYCRGCVPLANSIIAASINISSPDQRDEAIELPTVFAAE